MSLKFNIGDKAVYPGQGLGTIKEIQSKEIGGERHDFYIFQIIASGTTMLVPTKNPEKAGIRKVINSDEIPNVYSILKAPAEKLHVPWNRRFKVLNDKLRTGSANDLAEILRDLISVKYKKKELSFGEKKMYQKAKDMMVEELSAASAKDTAQIENEIEGILTPTQ